VVDDVRAILQRDPRIAYAILFGSTARGTLRSDSDLDVAIGLAHDATFTTRELGALISDLEAAAARPVDLVLLDGAAPALAFRIFRDGRILLMNDRQRFVARKARAIVEYLDFRPIEERCTRGVLSVATRG